MTPRTRGPTSAAHPWHPAALRTRTWRWRLRALPLLQQSEAASRIRCQLSGRDVAFGCMAQAAEVDIYVRRPSAATAVCIANRRATPNERCVKRSQLPPAAFYPEAAININKHWVAGVSCGLALCIKVSAVKALLALAAMDAALKRNFKYAVLVLLLMTSTRPLQCREFVYCCLVGELSWGSVCYCERCIAAGELSTFPSHAKQDLPCKPALEAG